jgi:beta-mannosidase
LTCRYWGYRFFHELLPATVANHGPGVPYWPGSPYGEDDPLGVNGVHDGDRQAWEVWHGIGFGTGDPTQYASRGEAMHFHRYADDTGKFISEFGIHASPELSTLRRWIPDSELTVHSPSFDHHNKDRPMNKSDALLEVETGLPDGIEQYVDFTMAAQAEGLKFGIEHYRRRQPSNSADLAVQ